MADLQVTVGADISQYRAGMAQAATTARTTSNDITRSLAQAERETTALGGSALSASMRMQQMRSGISAARDGVLAFTVGGQAAERSLLAMGHHINSLVNETGSFRGAMGALASSLWGPGGIILGLSVAVELFLKFRESQKKAEETASDFKKAQDAASESTSEEITKATLLYDATQNVNLSHAQRISAVKELQSLYPAYFGNLSQEAILAGKAKNAYDALTQSLFNKAAIEGASEPLKKLFKEYADFQALQKQIAAGADEFSQKIGLKPGQIQDSGFTIDQTDGKNELVSNSKVLKDFTDKIKFAKEAVQSMLQTFGIGSIIKKDDIDRIQQIREEIKRLQLDILAHPENKDADLLQIKALKKQLEELNPSVKQAKDGLSALQEELSKAEKKLQDSIIAGKTKSDDFDSPLLRKVLKLKGAIQDLNATTATLEAGLVAHFAGDSSHRNLGRGFDNGGLDDQSGVGNPTLKPRNFDEDLATIKAGVAAFNANADAVYRSQLALDRYKKELLATDNTVRLFGSGLTQAFQSALSGTQSLVSSMSQFLVQLIEKLVAAALAAAVLAALLSATGFGAGTSFSSIFGQLSGLTGMFGGTSRSSTGGGLPAMASGGIVTQPTKALIGEAGAEAVIPLDKLSEFKSMSGGGDKDVIIGKLNGSTLELWKLRSAKQKSRTS